MQRLKNRTPHVYQILITILLFLFIVSIYTMPFCLISRWHTPSQPRIIMFSLWPVIECSYGTDVFYALFACLIASALAGTLLFWLSKPRIAMPFVCILLLATLLPTFRQTMWGMEPGTYVDLIRSPGYYVLWLETIACIVLTALAIKATPSKPRVKNTAPGIMNAEELKRYKELLDMGAITPDEFEHKKREILNR